MHVRNIVPTIDTHTEGGPTRIIIGGVPRLQGETVKERMEFFRNNFDDLRKMVLGEPRGHKDMYGAVITEPQEPQADLGVFFLTNSGYLNMCVHSAIGVVAASLETGLLPKSKKTGIVRLDTPAGLIVLQPKYKNNRLKSLAIQTKPAFVFARQASLDLGRTNYLNASLVFSSVFFVLVDLKQLGIKIHENKILELISLGVKILEVANKTYTVSHPENPEINAIELAILYEDTSERDSCNAVISRSGNLDRSPCGAGTAAKMAYLFTINRLKLGENIVNESIYKTKFEGRIIKQINVGPYSSVITEISGSAYITGFHQFVLDENDPLRIGL